MKKMLALVLAMMLCLSCTAAMAQELQQADITVEPLEGVEMYFESLGFTITIPEILAQTEVGEADAAVGVFDAYALADASAYMMLGANELNDDTAIEGLIASLQENTAITDLGILTINGVSWLTYTLAETNQLMFCTDVGNILLTAYCFPADDEGFQGVMLQILGSLVQDAAE